MDVKDLINWGNLSRYLTKNDENRASVRKNKYPIKYEDDILELISLLRAWDEGKKLYTKTDIEEMLNEIDLKELVFTQL